MQAFAFGADAEFRYHDLPGAGTPLLFVHGLGCASSLDYPRVAADPALADRRRLLVDLPGFGFSDKPADYGYRVEDFAATLVALLDHLDLPPLDVYGHSMGGSVAIALTTLRPQRVRRLIISEANLDPGGGFFSRSIAAYAEADYVTHGHAATVAAAAETAPLWAASMAVASPLAVHRAASSLVAGSTPAWCEQLAALTLPRTAIFGAHSLPDPDTERCAALGVTVVIVPDAGHSMAWENPSGVAAAVAGLR